MDQETPKHSPNAPSIFLPISGFDCSTLYQRPIAL